jgi:hypothetical protein
MLPAPLRFIVAMIAYAINQRMARQLDYLQEEVRVLKGSMALVALDLRLLTLRDMWTAYPRVNAPEGVLQRASWFLERLVSAQS